MAAHIASAGLTIGCCLTSSWVTGSIEPEVLVLHPHRKQRWHYLIGKYILHYTWSGTAAVVGMKRENCSQPLQRLYHPLRTYLRYRTVKDDWSAESLRNPEDLLQCESILNRD